MKTTGWRAPQRAGTSIDPATTLRSAQAGRSGIIKSASAKVRNAPPSWRSARRHGAVVITRPE